VSHGHAREGRDSTDALIVCLYYPVFRVWAGYGGFGIRPSRLDHGFCRPAPRSDHTVYQLHPFTNYTHVDLLGAASVDLPLQAGIPCIVAAVAAAIEQQVGIQRSTSTWSATRSSSGCSRRPAEPITTRERGRAARRAQQQAQCNLVQLRHQLDPSERNSRRVRDVISLLEEYGGLA
jgi:hypothetical protein